jgi:sugar/nucleoside kinase (ribokinase family)
LSPSQVVVMGDLIYDVLAEMDGPLNTGTDTFAPVHARPGGSGANTAAWLARAGVETRFVARVGDDTLGRMLEEELREMASRPIWCGTRSCRRARSWCSWVETGSGP